MSETTTEPTPIEVRAPSGARLLEIVWSDGRTTLYEHRVLRAFCPCAHCQGHTGPIQWADGVDELPDSALEITDLSEVGAYALGIRFADGHSTGIYTFRYLQKLGEAYEKTRDAQKELAYER